MGCSGGGRAWRGGGQAWLRRTAGLIVALGAHCAPVLAQSGQARPGDVYRGLIDTGIWVELAHDGRGAAELAVLDGLPGDPPETRFLGLSAVQTPSGCALRSPDGSVTVSPCPTQGSLRAEISIGEARGAATLTSVGWTGSFAWGEGARGLGGGADVQAACRMQVLASAPGIAQTPLRRVIGLISTEAASLATSGGAEALARLRTERHRAYAMIALTPQEAQEWQRVQDGVAGRPVLGRPVPLTEATRAQIAFDQRVFNTPARRRAREELLQIDRSLSAIYDPVAAAQRAGVQARLRNERLPGAFNELRNLLDARQPGRIEDLIQLDTVVEELDQCAARLSVGQPNAARSDVRTALANRADEIVEGMRAAVASAGGSAAAAQALQRFTESPGVREALRQAGRESALAQAQAQVRQVASAEEAARLAGEREAARQAAADRIAPTTSGGRFMAERVARSVVRIIYIAGSTSSTGSGVVVAPGVILTNNHVIAGAPGGRVLVILNETRVDQGTVGQVIAAYPEYDIAVVRAPALAGRSVALVGGEPPQGAATYAFGFPGAVDERGDILQVATLTDGIVSRTVNRPVPRSNAPTMLIQHTAEVSPGNSGGPLFDACHRVIGINTFVDTSDRRTGARYLFAVGSQILPQLLRRAGVEPQISDAPCSR